ncbi:MAG: CoA transferase [Bacteroidota bacterium]|nr:CoA transferase [Bacteroidota bacterium]
MNPLNSVLTGIKVVELAGVLAGPAAGMFLAELGAEVLKVENQVTGGDVTRNWLQYSEPRNDENISSYYACANWGKSLITLDLNIDSNFNTLRNLLSEADVCIMSYKYGDREKFQLTDEDLQLLNPKLIIASVSGYGSTVNRVGYDAVIQAESGLISINGMDNDSVMKLPVAFVDLFASHQLREGILSAIIHRNNTGQGISFNISLLDSAISALANVASGALMTGKVPNAMGGLHPGIAPYGEILHFENGDRYILAIGNDKQFTGLCRIMGIFELAAQDKFCTNQQRVLHRVELLNQLNIAVLTTDSDKFYSHCIENQIPVGKIKTVTEALVMSQNMILNQGKNKSVRQSCFTDSDLLAPPALISK